MAFKGNRFTAVEPSSVAENRKGNGKKPRRSFDDGIRKNIHKRIEASQLPEVIIQRIQSFLDAKEAARTIILSKSWYEAWLTRPNLDFVESDFPNYLKNAFAEYVKKTLQRYDNKELKIQRFKLLTKVCCSEDHISQVIEWTKKAMKLSATDMNIELGHDINVGGFILPREVLESKSLVRLSLVKGIIDLRDKKVSCSRLKSLRLCRVFIEGDNIWDMLWMCPLIEELELSLCQSSYDNSINSLDRRLLLKPGLSVNGFHKLKVLSLKSIEIGEWLFRDLSSKFPFLKELTLDESTGYEEIQIYSNSLERIVFCNRSQENRVLIIKLDVPRIRIQEVRIPEFICTFSFF